MVINDGKMNPNKKPETPFMLKNSNKEFLERQKNVFDQLNSLQCNLTTNEEMDVDQTSAGGTSSRSVTKYFRGKESIFKVPQDPITYLRTIPDFKKNPHKWKKYSLADVREEDMSEMSNTKTALSFLNELKKRNSQELITETDEEPKKIVFKKVSSEGGKTDEETKPTFHTSKIVMPEYVVGQKRKKEKKVQKSTKNKNKELKLDHLYEEDDM